MVAAVVLAGPHIADLLARMGETSSSSRSSKPIAIPDWAALLPIVCIVVLVTGAARRPVTISVGKQYPVNAVKFLAASGIEGNLIQRFNWGEYLIWHLGPRIKVMVDGRRETVYPENVYQQYLDFQAGTGDWEKLLRDRPADVALLDKNSVSANLLRLKSDWISVYEDDVAVILARRDSLSAEVLRRTVAKSTPGPFLFP